MPEGTPEYPVRVDRRVFVPMDDGARIALTLYRPDTEGDGPFPTVVESIPYRKDDAFYSSDWSTYAYLAQRGFAGVRIDIRGTGASTGVIEDEYTAREQQDTLAVFRWLEEQAWCSGNLGMWGVSWGGFSALQTAMLRPPQLKAIAPVHATHDRFTCDVHYIGGSLHAQEQVDWPPSMVLWNAVPPDPDIVGDGWLTEWEERLERTPQWPGIWLRHQKRDAYWLHGSPSADYAAIECPTLLIGGWVDGYVDGMMAMAEHLRCPRRAVIGPWGHYRPATGVPGPTLDHLDLLARWFGHHLRGDQNGVMDMPAVTVFVRTEPPYDHNPGPEGHSLPIAGHWRAEREWPPADATTVVHRLADLANGLLEWSGPQWVGVHAPAWDRAGVGSGDSAEDDAHSVAFETAPLAEPFEILGVPEVEVRVTSSGRRGMVAARLIAVSPSGHGHLITRGCLNLVFAGGMDRPADLTPGQAITARFPLMTTSAVVPDGWRLRLALAGADFPVVWPPGEKATLTFDPADSYLTLPTVPQRDGSSLLDIPVAPPPPSPPGVRDEEGGDRHTTWSGRQVTHRRHRFAMEDMPQRDNLSYSSHETWTISVDADDPTSTRVRSDGEVRLGRPGWEIATKGSLDLSADEENFYLSIEVSATHDGRLIFARTWEDRIPREWA